MYQKVKAYVKTYHMLEKKDRVIAGISGGADSICLLFILLELQKEIGFSLAAVHVHHGLRGEAADADEEYVRTVCRKQGVKLEVFRRDVKSAARQYRLSEEEAGREVRREAFLEFCSKWGGTKIALAHHRDDNAETLLFHLCRGSSLEGLAGIAPVKDLWIRPLLCVNRREIESYLEKRGISYCTDETNLGIDYARNRLRNQAIPYLEEHINQKAASHMADAAEQLRMAAEYIREETMKCFGDCVITKEGERVLLKKRLQKYPRILRMGVIHETICQAAGARRDIGSVHVRMIEELLEHQVGREADLPYEVRAERCYEGVGFRRKTKEKSPEIQGEFRFRVFDREGKREAIPQKTYTKWFDYDIIKNTVKMRHREAGDYLTINKEGGRQKLKQYFINEKVPKGERDQIWLAADGSHIMWVVGYRQNQAYQITDKTKKVLEIEFCGGKSNGRDSKCVD